MRKNIIFATLAVMAIATSCSQEEEVTNPGKEARNTDLITFRASTNNATRGLQEYTTSNLSEFSVYATQANDVTDFYFSNATMTKSGKSWVSDEQHYWPSSGSLDFYAVAPTTISLESGPFDDDEYFPGFYNESAMYFKYTVKTKAAEQEDIIFAIAKGETKSSNAVNLNFRHAMSHVAFKAKLKDNANLKVVISDVEICNVPNAGKFVIVDEEWVDTYVPGSADSPWIVDDSSKDNFSLGLTNPVTVDSTEPVELYDVASANSTTDGSLFMIPNHYPQAWTPSSGTSASSSGKTYLRVKCSIYQEGYGYIWPTGVDANAETVDTKWVAIQFQPYWDMATSYTYTLIFGDGAGYDESSNTKEQVIVPITFNVSSVSDFEESSYDSDIDL